MKGKGTIKFTILKSKDKVDISIKDNGTGINENYKKKIFNSGFSTKNKGWGLGLSLAKRIITKQHNGEIYLKKSGINKGTEIVISIPLI